jgi:hypothetical protein
MGDRIALCGATSGAIADQLRPLLGELRKRQL